MNAEAVYTIDRLFNVTTLSDPDGLVSEDVFQFIVGLTHVTSDDTRVNAQYFFGFGFSSTTLEGPPTGVFGQFPNCDRVYYEVRYTF